MSVWPNGSYVIWTLEDRQVLYVRADHSPSALKTAEMAEAKCFGSAAAAWQFILTREELHLKVLSGYGGVYDADCRLAAFF
jgi:hypothetical protein